jgi:hypothetical protein
VVSGAFTNIANSTWTVPSVSTDASGYYTFYAPAGAYTFGLWPPVNTNLINYKNDTFVVNSDMTYNLVMSLGCKVSGIIQYSSGVAVSGVTTYLVNSTGYMFSSGRYSDAMLSSGSYSVVAPAGNYTLLAKLNSVQCYSEPNVVVNGDISKVITLINVGISPSSATLDVGQRYQYTASATGGSGSYTTYVWYANESAKSATSTPTFNFTPTAEGTYFITAVVKDSLGSTSTQSMTVSATVNSALSAPELSIFPKFLDQSQTCLLSSTEALTGTSPYSYQWYSMAPGENSYTLIANATSLNYSFVTSNHTAVGEWKFVFNVIEGASTPNIASSNSASVLVNAVPTITVSPELSMLDSGSTKTFIASTNGGSGSLTIEWFLDNAKVGGNNTSFPFVAASGTHTLYVKVTDSATPPLSAKSNNITIITNPPLVAPTIPTVNSTLDQGQTLKLNSNTATNGTAPYSYQWFAKAPGGNFSAIEGATSPICSFTLSNNATVGVWSLVLNVTDSAAAPVTVTSNPIEVTIKPAPSVSISPSTAAFTLGQSSLFTANAKEGSGSYTGYQWFVNGAAQQGQTNSSFSFSPTSVGSYSITTTVTDSFNATSNQSLAAKVDTSPVPTPTPSPTPAPTATPTLHPTLTPNPTSTPTLQPTLTPNTTPTPTSTENSPTPKATPNVQQRPDTETTLIVVIVAVVAALAIGTVFGYMKTQKTKKQ